MTVTDLTFSYSLQISTGDPNAKPGIEANSGTLAGFKLPPPKVKWRVPIAL